MIDFEGSLVIACAPEAAFSFVSNPANIPSYQDKVISVTVLSQGRIGKGTRFEEIVKMGPGKMAVSCEIVEYGEPRRVAFSARGTMVHCDAEYSFAPVPGGTRISIAGRAQLQGWRRLLEPLMQSQIRGAVQGELRLIQERLTSQATAPGPALAAVTG